LGIQCEVRSYYAENSNDIPAIYFVGIKYRCEREPNGRWRSLMDKLKAWGVLPE